MSEANGAQRVETVIIGAGQAGLSTGYHLAKRERDFVILDANTRVGDNWRCHWDTLRLYSPAHMETLPGMRFPASRMTFPTKDEMADFLESYATRFHLPVRLGVTVRELSRVDGEYVVRTDGATYSCDNVVVASGTFGRTPRVPALAAELDSAILQLHSSAYKNPDSVPPGGVLVVGASHSGGDIAYELARAGHPVVLSGHINGELPFNINRKPAYAIAPVLFFLAKHVLTLRTPIGRKLREEIRSHGGPLIRVKRADLVEAGVDLVEDRTTGVRDGRPVLADGRVLDVTTVVWCTGFRQDFSWIDLPVIGSDGWPLEQRGVVRTAPGLYFVGLAFQYAFASMLVGGAGRDGEYVARHIVSRKRAPLVASYAGGRELDS
ncbi:flavin-containing monooxygenase [Prauserella cavernicola]|uniref:NAD(P)-binding domain-containing protein n=1 Tax=Prauserella cavernicola TaxID=2800127 RepID=A0A934QTK7_9PSEU|nr:NAD(P)-binding domain-containing protein [Prauserella cavernicola]MBK1786135.1 NAD(P)-binding domain-containing protein [Prauserella cavernicola]